MHPVAIDKARSRLRLARAAVETLRQAPDTQAFQDSWYSFLTASKNIYDIFKKGADTTTPQSRQWLGGKKRERRQDPLLQYLFEARNSDQHGLDFSLQTVERAVAWGPKPGHSRHMRVDGTIGAEINLRIQPLDGLPPPPMEITPAHAYLRAVTARGNVVYQPPAMHLGLPIPDNSPLAVADLALAYFEKLIDEAAGLTVP
jgi:hypothetical protein